MDRRPSWALYGWMTIAGLAGAFVGAIIGVIAGALVGVATEGSGGWLAILVSCTALGTICAQAAVFAFARGKPDRAAPVQQ